MTKKKPRNEEQKSGGEMSPPGACPNRLEPNRLEPYFPVSVAVFAQRFGSRQFFGLHQFFGRKMGKRKSKGAKFARWVLFFPKAESLATITQMEDNSAGSHHEPEAGHSL